MAAVVHISEEEAARDFAAVVRRVCGGDEVVVEQNGKPVVIMKAAEATTRGSETASPLLAIPGRTAEEIIQRLRDWETLHGPLTMDEGFAEDVEEAHMRFNQPLDSTKWD